MAAWVLRLTCVSLTLALSGSPAVLAVCISLCQERATVDPVQSGHASHEAHAPPAAAAPASHAHHGAAAEHASHVQVTPGQPELAPDARVKAPCSNCCLDAQFASATGARPERSDAQLIVAAPTAYAVSLLPPLQAHSAAPSGPPIPPPSPARAPLSLRI